MADKMKIPTQRKHKQSAARHGAGGRAYYPTVDMHGKEVNVRGLSPLDKILISNGGAAHATLRGRGTRFATPIKKRRRD